MSLIQSYTGRNSSGRNSTGRNSSSEPCTNSVGRTRSRGALTLPTRSFVALGAIAVALGCKSEGRQFDDYSTVDSSVGDTAASSGPRDTDNVDGGSTNGGSTDATTTEAVTVELTSGSGSETPNASASSQASSETSAPPSHDSSSSRDSSEPTGDDFGVGAPPNFGNLGSGEGRILVVNTSEEASVDVWLAGNEQPSAEGIATDTATIVTVTRGAQRVVLTRHGTQDVVGCSDWFPLRGSEQWAVVPRGGEHTCAGSGDGSTLSFRQTQSLDTNPIRYVHATTPDSFSFTRNGQTEPGTLAVSETLSGTNLPSCRSGCDVTYEVATANVEARRHFSVTVRTVEEVPPVGEVLLIVLG